MIKRLSKHGNSLALVIDRGVLDLLKIDSRTPLEITTDGELLLVSPVRDASRKAKFEKGLAAINKRYGSVLRRLAK